MSRRSSFEEPHLYHDIPYHGPQSWLTPFVEVSAPATVVFNVEVPMRDGILLRGDLHLPALCSAGSTVENRASVVLVRTPYHKSKTNPDMRHPALFWVQSGFACFIQDCRGRGESDGEFFKYIHEAEDGYDTVAWLAAQSWCTGNVYGFGVSYLAHTQTSMACLNPPALKGMFVVKGGFYDAFTSGIRQGGVLEARQWLWAMKNAPNTSSKKKSAWGSATALSAGAQRSLSETDKELKNDALIAWMKRYPFRRGDSPLSLHPEYEQFVLEFATQGVFNPDFWRKPGLSIVQSLDQFSQAPMFLLSGWYDIYARSSIELYDALVARDGPKSHRLLMGPWIHTGPEWHTSGEVDFGMAATLEKNVAPSRYDLARAWFDYCEGKEAELITSMPNVLYFRMGGGEGHATAQNRMFHGGMWLAGDEFPPKNTIKQSFVLVASGRLRVKKKILGTRAAKVSTVADGIPPAKAMKLRYVPDPSPYTTSLTNGLQVPSGMCTSFQFDPRKPFPSIGGHVTPVDHLLFPGAYNQVERADHALCDADSAGLPLSSRGDTITFRSKVLTAPVDVTGTPSVTLYVSSSCTDTDFYALLIDEYPPSESYPRGFLMNVTHGIQRVSLRNQDPNDPKCPKGPELMTPEHIYKIKITMFPTSNLFDVGHRVTVLITSSCYPHFDVNPNTGSPPAGGNSQITHIAENRIWHTTDLQSSLDLPVVPDSPSCTPQFVRAQAVPETDDEDEGETEETEDEDDSDKKEPIKK